MKKVDFVHAKVRIPAEMLPVMEGAMATGMYADETDLLLSEMRRVFLESTDGELKGLMERTGVVRAYDEFSVVTVRLPRGFKDAVEERRIGVSRLAVMALKAYSERTDPAHERR